MINFIIKLSLTNKAAISLVKNDAISTKSKHIDLSYHIVHDMRGSAESKVNYIPPQEMTIDPTTK